MTEIKNQVKEAVEELIEISGIKEGEILVVGCSSSEICGHKIGTNSASDVAKDVFEVIYEITKKKNIFLAAQCCEHLNRCLILEGECAFKFNYDEVNVVPQIKAGGSFATAAYNTFKNPVAVEKIRASAGLDIGSTLIGMHLKEVAVPVRLKINKIGEAPVTAARTRPKFVGGIRAVYDENKM